MEFNIFCLFLSDIQVISSKYNLSIAVCWLIICLVFNTYFTVDIIEIEMIK